MSELSLPAVGDLPLGSDASDADAASLVVENLTLESTLQDLPLYRISTNLDTPGVDLARALDADPLLPGAILLDDGHFAGVLSRRRFLRHLSRPYGQELFLRRPLRALYPYARATSLVMPGSALVVEAARRSLQRSPEMLYEPIVVCLEDEHCDDRDCYRLLDVHRLLVAQSEIQELAMQRIREQSRAQIIQTEKMASLGQMVAGIAHEIKNPVNYIAGNTVYLSGYIKDLMDLVETYEGTEAANNPEVVDLREAVDLDFLKGDLPKLLESMSFGAEQLKRIVAGLQNFSHMGSEQRKPANLHECIDSTLIVLNNRLKEGIEVERQYGTIPEVPCYSGQLSQVFANLLGNAIDALLELWETRRRQSSAQRLRALEQSLAIARTANLPEDENGWKPRIVISTQLTDGPDGDGGDRPAVNPADPWVLVEIADNGPGIPESIQAQIFETFFTTKPVGKGTGLGLAICHEIVTQRHGGHLHFRSPANPDAPDRGGTAFSILLPLRADAVSDESAGREAARPS